MTGEPLLYPVQEAAGVSRDVWDAAERSSGPMVFVTCPMWLPGGSVGALPPSRAALPAGGPLQLSDARKREA